MFDALNLGFAGLGTTIAALGLATSKPIEVEYAVRASSRLIVCMY